MVRNAEALAAKKDRNNPGGGAIHTGSIYLSSSDRKEITAFRRNSENYSRKAETHDLTEHIAHWENEIHRPHEGERTAGNDARWGVDR